MKGKFMNIYIVALMLSLFSFSLTAKGIILNEYNAVAPDKQLKNMGYDTYYGKIDGNGGDWIELIVTEDFLDIRGATLKIERSKGVPLFSGKFPHYIELAYLRRGTIITVSNEPTELSYRPLDGSKSDWTININVDDMVNREGSFEISDSTMDIWIEAIDRTLLMEHSGEIVKGWGIDDEEIFKLKRDPSADINPDDEAYGDDTSGKQAISTFGSPNIWIDSEEIEHTQNLSKLRDIESSINIMMLLNEYNAVSRDRYLKSYGIDYGYDTKFGRVYGNGGNWIEFIAIKDNIDLRGAKLRITICNCMLFEAKFPDIEALSNIRSGTILTVSDSVATDLSYNPSSSCEADWNLNLNISDLDVEYGTFQINSGDLKVSIVSGSGDITILPESGSAISETTLNQNEVYKLMGEPSVDISPTDRSSYGRDYYEALSTFGSGNRWRDGSGAIVEQNLTAVRLITLEKDFKAKGDSLLLNEYNGVGYDRYLKDSGSDSYFGTVAGNGGSWLELVVKENYLNLQRAEIKISENCREIFRGRFPELLTLAHLREGTIVTLSSEPTDMSYFPFAPEGNDWRLNINIDDLMDTSGIFKLSDKNISISILDGAGERVLLAPSGEGIWRDVVDDREVYKFKGEPSRDITPFDINYGDDLDREVISTFGSPNRWVEDGVTKSQKFNIRENRDLVEVGGIALSKIDGLKELRDGESILYIKSDNSLWIADDDSHNLFEIDYTTYSVKSTITDVDLGNFAPEVGECDSDDDGVYSGACDIESIAYNPRDDRLYILTGRAPGTPAIFELRRDSIGDRFKLSRYRELNGIEFPAVIFIDGKFIVAETKSLYLYDFETNSAELSKPLYTTPTGKIVGLAYDGEYLWVTTSNFELMKVKWATKETVAIYNMGDMVYMTLEVLRL